MLLVFKKKVCNLAASSSLHATPACEIWAAAGDSCHQWPNWKDHVTSSEGNSTAGASLCPPWGWGPGSRGLWARIPWHDQNTCPPCCHAVSWPNFTAMVCKDCVGASTSMALPQVPGPRLGTHAPCSWCSCVSCSRSAWASLLRGTDDESAVSPVSSLGQMGPPRPVHIKVLP